ncbi:MAG: endonuclease III [Planctomycetota bacterium]|nr:MAG: endonuclease III [Planctomycetota bacterium]
MQLPYNPGDVRRIDELLNNHWPDAACELQARDPFEFLVAVICSAQTSDQRVNQVMAVLQEHLCGLPAYAAISIPDLSALLSRLPLYRQKARAISECARLISELHGGELPRDPHALRQLPGVGAKTAAVVLGNRLGVPAIAVDSHVARCSQRLGLSRSTQATSIELDLCRRFPQDRWVQLCHQLIRLGRAHCRPKAPRCSSCPLRRVCPANGVNDAR